MILVRDVFQLKFGKAKEAKALWKEATAIRERSGPQSLRALVDLTGPYYTFVMESTYEDLSAFEKSLKDTMSKAEFGNWYQKFVSLVESGKREIYTVVD